MSRNIIVGLSGGVDSSVAAHLLQNGESIVRGLFMKNWEEDDTEEYCTATEDLRDAQSVADRLGIELLTMNFASEYWDRVFEHFLTEYRAGRTPNPDILCNKEIKFRAFLDHALEQGADKIATGHYARIREVDGQFQLLRGVDSNKDQSYFLYTLNQHQLSHSLFPVGELEKPRVREIAHELGLVTHDKKDSTGICFIGERRFKDFLARYLPAQPGEIQTPDGEVIGHHSGLMYHTLGQRQGLGIGGLKNHPEEPWFVAQKDLKNNILIAVQGHDHPLLFSNQLTASQLHWVSGLAPVTGEPITAKVRYRQVDQACIITHISNEIATVQFDESQRAVTPGQSIVFYDGERCLGGGIIETTGNRQGNRE
ncbi:MAG: tRNA 2-thiouridine(34) synthase MnmA [Gammaproteobacteria bacterium]|nr:tRNA 2-thiouridine(34) synthase MnmA [Gammaproteobacteria bacterium]